VDTGFSGSVSVALDPNFATTGLGGTLTVKAVNGVATFAGLTIDPAGTYALDVSSQGLIGATTLSFLVQAAPANHLVVSAPAGNVLTGRTLSLTGTALDAFGNVDTSFSGNVSVALSNNPTGAALGGLLTTLAVSGTASFNLTISKPGSGYTLQASSTGLSSGTSPAFAVTNDQLVVTTPPPASIAAGSAFGLVVKAENGSGAVDSSFTGSVAVALDSQGGSSGTLSGTLTVQATGGVATFSGLKIDEVGSDDLIVSSTGVAGATTASFAVTATRLVVTAQPPGLVTAGAGFSLEVSAEDALGNVDTNFGGSVTLALAGNPAGGKLGGTLTIHAVNGVADFAGLTIDRAGNGYSLQATSSGLSAATTAAFDVAAAGVPTQLVVTIQPPASIAAGSNFTVVVAAEDSAGNVATGFNGSVTLTLNNFSGNPSATLGGTLTLDAFSGVAKFTGLTLTQAGPCSLSASSGSLPAVTTNLIDVTAQPATQLAVVGPGGNVLAGSPFSVTVDAEDPYGNLAPGFSGSVTLALANNPTGATLGGTLTVQATAGVANFSGLTISNAGQGYSLQATSNGLGSAASSAFNVSGDQLLVTTQPPAGVVAGRPFGLVVKALTGAGIVDTSFTGTVTLALANNPAARLGGTRTVRAVNGVATFSGLTINQPGLDVLSVSGNGLAGGTTSSFTVTAPATRLVITTPPPGLVTAGARFFVEVSAEDRLGNVDTSFSGSVTIALASNPTGATLGGTRTVHAVNGVADFGNLKISKPGTYNLRGTSNIVGLAVKTSALDVTAPGIATGLVVTTQPPARIAAGKAFGLVVKAEDSFGRVASAFSGTVTITDPASGSTLASVKASHGVARFTGLKLTQAGDSILSVSAAGLPGATTNPFLVTGGKATALLLEGPGGNALTGSPFGFEALAVDAGGNIDPSFQGNVTIVLGKNPTGATLGGTLTVRASGGVALFPDLTLDRPGSGYTLQASSTGLGSMTSLPFNVTSDQLVVTLQPPARIRAGRSFGLVVKAEDASGKVDSAFTGSVTATLINLDGTSGARLSGKRTARASGGVARFAGLTINQAGSYALALTSTGAGRTATNGFGIGPLLG
jgi:hypothetical protein